MTTGITPTVVLVHGASADAAISQRPWAAILEERAHAAAWRSLPSWAVVATADSAIHPGDERHRTHRAGARTIEGDASPSIALSQPRAVAALVLDAVRHTSADEAVTS